MNGIPLSSRVAMSILGERLHGQLLAKEAGIGFGALGAAARSATRVPTAGAIAPGDWLTKTRRRLSGGLGVKGNLALGAGTLAAGTLAVKGVRSGLRHMREEPTPQTFGPAEATPGYRLPFGVNSYGVPQLGTPLT